MNAKILVAILLLGFGPRLLAADRDGRFWGRIVAVSTNQHTIVIVAQASTNRMAIRYDKATVFLADWTRTTVDSSNFVTGAIISGYGWQSPLDGLVAKVVEAQEKPHELKIIKHH